MLGGSLSIGMLYVSQFLDMVRDITSLAVRYADRMKLGVLSEQGAYPSKNILYKCIGLFC